MKNERVATKFLAMLDDRSYMRSEYRSGWSVTTSLLVANIACFILQSIAERQWPGFYKLFALSPSGLAHGWVWQLFTFQFLHGGLFHLLGNCLGLYFFGRAMEQMLGSRSMLTLYLLSGTVGGLLQVGLGFVFPSHFGGIVVGASAGVFGLIAAFATRAPEHIITLLVFFILPVSFKARVLLYVMAGLAIFGIFFDGGGIAHAAHLGGMAVGILYIRWFPEGLTIRLSKSENRDRTWDSGESKSSWLTPPSPPKRDRREDAPPAEFISREVDPILEKISEHGIHSLTPEERRILESARNRMAKK